MYVIATLEGIPRNSALAGWLATRMTVADALPRMAATMTSSSRVEAAGVVVGLHNFCELQQAWCPAPLAAVLTLPGTAWAPCWHIVQRAAAIPLTHNDRGTRQPVQGVPLAVFSDSLTTATV